MALDWAALGVAVLPVCGPNEAHECGCPVRREPHLLKDIGKAPWTLHGVDDATTDEAQLRKWWTAYPTANVAISLASAALFAIDTDSPTAETEAVARGLPRAPRRVSGHGNIYLYLRPKDCPIYRPTKKGESKAIDLLTGGYAIVYGVHQSGADIYTEPVELPTEYAPPWAVELLKAAASKTGADVDLTLDDDEPPVRLFGDALRRWKGEQPNPDRSLYLFELGSDLAHAGMTANGIVQALAERDRTLGFKKYSDRRDGGKTEYARIAARALDRYPLAADADPDPLSALLVAQLHEIIDTQAARITQLTDRLERLETRHRNVEAVHTHPYLSRTESSILIAVADIVDEQRRQQEARDALKARLLEHGNEEGAEHVLPILDPHGGAPVFRVAVAERVHVSESTVGLALKKFDAQGLLQKDTVPVPPGINPHTGEIKEAHLECRVRLPLDDLDEYFQWVVNEYHPDATDEHPAHGGLRGVKPCEQHPEAGVIILTSVRCAEPHCAALLAAPRKRVIKTRTFPATCAEGPADTDAPLDTYLTRASCNEGPPKEATPIPPAFLWDDVEAGAPPVEEAPAPSKEQTRIYEPPPTVWFPDPPPSYGYGPAFGEDL